MNGVIGTVYDWKGQGGVQSHITRGTKTLCGRTPTEPRWSDIQSVGSDHRPLVNVSCNRCRSIAGTYVNTEDIPAAVQAFLDREFAKAS